MKRCLCGRWVAEFDIGLASGVRRKLPTDRGSSGLAVSWDGHTDREGGPSQTPSRVSDSAQGIARKVLWPTPSMVIVDREPPQLVTQRVDGVKQLVRPIEIET